TWHQRLGHLNKSDINKLQGMAFGIVVGQPSPPNRFLCTGCLVGKDYRQIS
ncbi:hypothetical protein L211DRAFT_778544, partial [Terfezia boudieri ATCC MYA-4762]